MPFNEGFKYTKYLLEKVYGNPHKILASYKKEIKLATNQIWGCQSLSEVSHLSVKSQKHVIQSKVECMSISKLPGEIMERWNRKVLNIRRF